MTHWRPAGVPGAVQIPGSHMGCTRVGRQALPDGALQLKLTANHSHSAVHLQWPSVGSNISHAVPLLSLKGLSLTFSKCEQQQMSRDPLKGDISTGFAPSCGRTALLLDSTAAVGHQYITAALQQAKCQLTHNGTCARSSWCLPLC